MDAIVPVLQNLRDWDGSDSKKSILDPILGVVSEKCKNDLISVIDGVKSSELWSYSLLDASTKVPSGILTGNLIDLGNFDECLGIKFPNSSTRGQHCLASFSVSNASRANDSLGVLPSLLWSYCIPSSCNAMDLQQALNLTWSSVPSITVAVSPENCQIKKEDLLDTSAIFGICFCSVVLLICVMSTLYDIFSTRKDQKTDGVLRSFSILLNAKRLLETNVGSETMRPLNGLRFLSIAWIVLGHRYFFQSISPIFNLLEFTKIFDKLQFQLVAGGELAVDTFFILSGFLNAYFLLKVLDSTRSFPAFKYYFHRYIRTTPALAGIIVIYATWFVHIGNGPLWNSSIQPWQKFCTDNWWVNLLYINNYYSPVSQCAGQSWYLAVDMQLYFLAPLVILPCWKWPKVATAYLAILLALSAVAQFVVAYVDRLRMSFTITQDMDLYKKVTADYQVATHTRATPYIIGLMLGLFLHRLRKSGSRPVLAVWAVLAGWGLATGLCLSAILGNYPFMLSETQHPYNRLESSFFIGLFRLAWGTGISWIIFACLYGYGGIINDILSWSGFTPLSRLTYSIFLTHLSVQQYQLGVVRTSAYFSDFEQIHRFLGDLTASVFTGAALCLMFESPIVNIEKHFQKPRVKKNVTEGGEENLSYVNDNGEKYSV